MERKVLFKLRTGSHLYGLNTPESDEDFVSIFMPSASDLLGLTKVEEIDNSSKSSSSQRRNTSEDVDDKMYSLHKFMRLLLQNNPNIVELLFPTNENIIVDSGVMKELRANFDKIISTKVYHSFKGYAFSQKKKLTVKSERYKSLIKATIVLGKEWDDRPAGHKITEDEADELNSMLKYYKGTKGNTENFHKGMDLWKIYDLLCRERDNYGWRVKTDSFDTLGYDIKFGYHLIRILVEGYELLSTGKLTYPISGLAREQILAIRSGQVNIDQLLTWYSDWEKKCDQAYSLTKLRTKPDWNWANEWVISNTKRML